MSSLSHFSVKELVDKKAPSLHGIPRVLLISVLKVVMKERKVNSLLREAGNLTSREFIQFVLNYLNISVRFEGLEHIPSQGRITYCANHPTGALDGLILLLLMTEKSPRPMIPVNDVAVDLLALRDHFWPLDKLQGGSDGLGGLNELYKGASDLGIFPAGVTGRPKEGILVDYPWVKSFVKLSRQYGRTIVPVHFSGQNSPGFYRLWKWRGILGIKINFEMFFLIRELFLKRGYQAVVTLGEPIILEKAGNPQSDFLKAQEIRNICENLGEKEVVYG